MVDAAPNAAYEETYEAVHAFLTQLVSSLQKYPDDTVRILGTALGSIHATVVSGLGKEQADAMWDFAKQASSMRAPDGIHAVKDPG